MLEYLGLSAAIKATTDALDTAQAVPQFKETAAKLADGLRAEPDIAYFGAFIGPMLALSGSDPLELQLLRAAHDLWARALQLAEELNTARVEFELSLARTDLPDALNVLQMGLNRLAGLHAVIKTLENESKALQAKIDRLDHIPAHPRQTDEPTANWDAGNLFAGRRGLAFVEAMIAGATNSRGQALAAGALASYSGHVAGSAWLGAVVGGPRRLHRFRDRLARNTVGSALRDIAATPDPGDLAGRVRFKGRDGPALPPDLAAQVTAALGVAYPGHAVPDLVEVQTRLVEHLDLLAGFAVPYPPAPPPIAGDPSHVSSIETQTFDQPQGDEIPGTIALGTDTNHDDPGIASQKDSSNGACLGIFILIITLGIVYLIWCIGRLTEKEKCGVEDFVGASSPEPPDPRAPQATQQMIETLRDPDRTNHILNDIYQLQLKLWQALAAARSYLLVCGLLYPTEDERKLALFKQFLRVPGDPIWPHREDPAAIDGSYARPPTTPAETAAATVPYGDHALDWLLHVDLRDNQGTFSEVVFNALQALQEDSRQRTNLDLDADRGRLHPAWSVASGASVTDQPVPVVILPYEGL